MVINYLNCYFTESDIYNSVQQFSHTHTLIQSKINTLKSCYICTATEYATNIFLKDTMLIISSYTFRLKRCIYNALYVSDFFKSEIVEKKWKVMTYPAYLGCKRSFFFFWKFWSKIQIILTMILFIKAIKS